MKLKGILWGCLMTAFVVSASAERTYKYRVNLKDKVGTAYSVDKPEEFLSERALDRRNRQQLPVDETDLPVSQAYVKELLGTGARLVTTSKWNNTVVLEVKDLRNLYAGQEATVRPGHGITDWFQIDKRSTSRLYIVTLLI